MGSVTSLQWGWMMNVWWSFHDLCSITIKFLHASEQCAGLLGGFARNWCMWMCTAGDFECVCVCVCLLCILTRVSMYLFSLLCQLPPVCLWPCCPVSLLQWPSVAFCEAKCSSILGIYWLFDLLTGCLILIEVELYTNLVPVLYHAVLSISMYASRQTASLMEKIISTAQVGHYKMTH